MKIGILTHHYINNYGAFLQAYALQETLTESFPEDEVEIIHYVNFRHYLINSAGFFRYYKDRENLSIWMKKGGVPEKFYQARRKYLKLSPLCCSISDINRQNYDCIVIGSDEVWNFTDRKGNGAVKFGRGLTCKNLIAYAPSAGDAAESGKIPGYVTDGIRSFSAISVRDEMTGRLVKKIMGECPEMVLDPTFLIDFPEADAPVKQRPYILFYYCDHLPKKIRQQIFAYARQHGYGVYGAGDSDMGYDACTVDLSPFEWVSMFRNASFVFTGTFHGTVFSILSRCQFKVFLTNKSRKVKVSGLLKNLGLKGREIKPDFVLNTKVLEGDIDYDQVFAVIEKEKDKSLHFLLSSIQRLQGE